MHVAFLGVSSSRRDATGMSGTIRISGDLEDKSDRREEHRAAFGVLFTLFHNFIWYRIRNSGLASPRLARSAGSTGTR